MPIGISDVIVFSAGGIVTYFGRQLFEQRMAISRIHKTASISEYNKAVSVFRGAFAPAIVKFKITSDLHAIDTMLREELIPQGIAIERFRPFVKNKKAYQEAWEDYHLSHKRDFECRFSWLCNRNTRDTSQFWGTESVCGACQRRG